MEDLCPRRVWGFSTGCILAPRRWTLDVASHHLFHSHEKSGVVSTESVLSGCDAFRDALPLGTSSNTARFESMDETGATLYVTELFVPLTSVPDLTGAGASDDSDYFTLFAERLRESLQRQSSWRLDPTKTRGGPAFPATAASAMGRVEGESAPLRAWVMEVTPLHSSPPICAVGSPVTSGDTSATTVTSCSIAAALQPFFRLFLEVVWDDGGSSCAVSATVEDAVHQILAHQRELYRTPTLELDGFRCFSGSATTNEALPGELAGVSPQSVNSLPRAPIATQLREPCTPHVLVDMGDDTLSSAWSIGLYSAAGASFFQLILTPSLPPLQQQQHHQNAVVEACCGRAPWSLYPVSKSPAVGDGGTTSAVQHLLQHDLQLCWEGLALAARRAAAEIVVAVGAFPLDLPGVKRSSMYSFLSVEQAWEAHVRSVLKQRRRQEYTGDPGRDPGKMNRSLAQHGAVIEWDLRRLSTSSRPVSEQLEAMLHKAELHQFVLDDPSLSSSERAMRLVARDVGAPLVPPRCTSYLLRVRRGAPDGEQPGSIALDGHANNIPAAQKVPLTKATHHGTEGEELYVLQLHSPRVLSTHALVVCMAVPTSTMLNESCLGTCHGEEGDGTARLCASDPGALAAAALGSMYRVAPHVPSLWLPREVNTRRSSGVCSRSGRLLLYVPASDTRYGDLHLIPVASNVFTTLGSIMAWTAQKSSPCRGDNADEEGSVMRFGTPSFASSTCAFLANMCAVWTLIGDGRSAAAYLEDMLSEYMYDTGAKSLLNVSQPSQHECQPGRLVVRRRPKQKYRAEGSAATAKAGFGAELPSVGVQEVHSAWLDVGATNRLFLSVRDVGAGEVLLIKASLVGPHTELPHGQSRSCDAITTALEAASRAEEKALEDWIGGVTAGAVPPHRR
ncbi:hypothetical protein JKF63_06403 [Porcisia hertigi]|uniref:Uncharacterized protein n=1 Tax=Porcisia hertigi TaxID=2761500 RepID=A0A836YJ73_9TRYP|nr:hypothetical protein JKF63_06403 [Porcisia hertigi]